MKNIIISLCLIVYIFVNTKIYAVNVGEPNFKEGEKITLDEEGWTIIKMLLDIWEIEYKEIEL